MTVKQLIDKLNEIEDKNRKVAVMGILRYPFNQANIKEVTKKNDFGNTVWINIESQ